MKSTATLLTCATSLFFLTACGGGAAIKNAEVPVAKPVSQPVMTKSSPELTKAPDLNEAQLKATLVGHTQTGTGEKGNKWTATYYPNGTIKGTSLSKAGVNYSDTGTYSIQGNILCRQWSEWLKAATACHAIQKREKDYYATLQSGEGTSYAFTMGAPAKANQEQAALTDAEIKSLLTGKTMVGSEGWTDKINEDGTFDSIYKGKASKGKYSIANGLYCTGTSSNRCRSITKTAGGYYAKSVSGGGDSFSFTVR